MSQRDASAGEVVLLCAPRKLTRTEKGVLLYVFEHEGKSCSKAELAVALGRCKKTIDRSISRLRADGLLVSEPTFDDSGAQKASVYRLGSSLTNLA